MVQVKMLYWFDEEDPNVHNNTPEWQGDYWKLGKRYDQSVEELEEYLESKGFVTKKRRGLWPTKSTLVRLARRCERGWPLYEAATDAELMKFVSDRGMVLANAVEGQKHSQRHARLAQLNLADETRDFPHFVDLPPELQDMVFIQYFKALGEIPTRFAQPPITLINKDVRDRALPLFYEHSTFTIQLKANLERTHLTRAFVRAIPDEHFARIKNFVVVLHGNIAVVLFEKAPIKHSIVQKWYMDVKSGIVTSEFVGCNSMELSGSRRRGDENLETLLGSIMARPALQKLVKRDVRDFRNAIERACSDQD